MGVETSCTNTPCYTFKLKLALHELVVAIRACWSIHEVRERPEDADSLISMQASYTPNWHTVSN